MRLTSEQVREDAWAKGWEVFASSLRGFRGYTVRPARWAIFEREQYTYRMHDLAEVSRWLTSSAATPIATRVDYDYIKWRQAQRRKEAA
jgi:hypothetical protein